MNYLTLPHIIRLHDEMIHKMQGLKGFENSRIVYLDSALKHIQNDVFYPSFLDKLTHLFFACIQFHPFLDGNKRTALLVAELFIQYNNHILPDDFYPKMENIAVNVANGEIQKDKLKIIFQEILNFPRST